MIKIAESYCVDYKTGKIIQPGQRYEIQEKAKPEEETGTVGENSDKGKKGKRQILEE